MTGTADGPDACGDCALAVGEGCCGASGHGASLLRSDRAVLAVAGAVIVVIALGVLTVPSSRHPMVAIPASATLLLGSATTLLGAAGRWRPDPTAAASARRALHTLPWAVGGLVVTLAAGLARSVFG